MTKHLCCSALGKIYYANVNDKGIITGQKIDLTEDAIVAVMDKLSWLAIAKKPFDGKAEIEINGFRLSIDGTGNSHFMEKHAGGKPWSAAQEPASEILR
ncbi:hypothetical protein [Phascolarctobacterium succinatutens]|uniref:DUF7446 family protein n=1 Tax=Phascolarctobacterium succinatutens TaxID=626940 RepID=UPI0025F61EB1|nr:hypothetical protein [Phascolarctobacterium succinatutens]